MRIWVGLLCLLGTAAAAAEPAKTAVFDIEFLNMSQEREQPDEAQRLVLASEELRRLLKSSDQIALVDLQPRAEEIRAMAPLYRCNGCDEQIARELGAELAVSGFVQKTSNLILSFVVTIKDAHSGQVVRAGQVDIRGNNDETWLRGVRWLVKNRLLAEPLPNRT
jgi:Protein of unknown function (DUF2380)